MAFLKIDEFTDRMANRYRSGEKILSSHQVLPEAQFYSEANQAIRSRIHQEQGIIFRVLKDYYESVLSIPKFKGQRAYCKSVMMELDNRAAIIYFDFKPAKAKKPTI